MTIPEMKGVVKAEGDLDFRGTMGVDRDTPVGFSAIRLSFELDTEASPDDLDAVLAATERYCVVYQSMAKSPEMSVTRYAAPPRQDPE